MNTATGNLENDHVYILQLTEIMERITRKDSPDTGHIATIIEIIKNFADGIHHAKEENLLFPKLEEKGLSPHQGPVAVMLHEHAEGRNFVKNIVDNLEIYNNGNKEALSGIYRNMLGYASLLENHIAKENNILFRMADNVLSKEEQSDLLKNFGIVESSAREGNKSTDYVSLILELAAIYLAD
jgi:hemerythrin-like domain-containing protein